MFQERSEIYVMLLNEGIEVWRPVAARFIRGNIFEITQRQDSELEEWQFPFGSKVLCEEKEFSDGKKLVAVSLFE